MKSTRIRLGVAGWIGFSLLLLVGTSDISQAKSWLVQAEHSASTTGWQIEKASGASAEAVLTGGPQDALAQTNGIKVSFPTAGKYWIWVRYQNTTANAYGSFYALVRSVEGEVVAWRKLNWMPRLPTQYPYRQPEVNPAGRFADGNYFWEAFPLVAERPLTGTLHFGGIAHGGKTAPRRIDCAIITDQAGFNPIRQPWKNLDGFSTFAIAPVKPPRGLRPATGFPPNSSFFAGTAEPSRQFKMGLGYTAAIFHDDAQFVQLGFNRTHGANNGSLQYGIRAMGGANLYETLPAGIARQYSSPQGRFVNAAGEVGRTWSFFFPPLQDSLLERTRTALAPFLDKPTVESWRIVAESGGYMDYSPLAQQAFRHWLAGKYQNIERLNSLWGTTYRDFDEVQPPTNVTQNFAAWFAYREFNGEAFARMIGRQAAAVREISPEGEMTQQLSNLDLLSPRFMSLRPMDWEQFINLALKDVDNVGWDAYAVDDYMGAEIDLVRSLARGKNLLNEEWNTHAADPRIAARTFWAMVGKGLRGIHLFHWQEGTFHDSYPKWALVNHDFTPKQKLGAIADGAQEVHRLERLLMAARPVVPVKPVALYYDAMNLSLAQPLASAWGEPVNTPYHVYAALRGMGYPVRWITPSQIEKGELREVAAVVLMNAGHVPRAAASALAAWVHQGGCVIADQWPGALDEYNRPQDTLAPVFGIQKQTTEKNQSQLALQESSQGYGEVTINALSGRELSDSVGEIWQQWDATHPVAHQMGNYTLSGYGLTKVRCTSGQVIGMTFGGGPGIVLNTYGKGQALYIAMMLGSLYESSATRYEWDSARAGTAYPRLLDTFLRSAGVKPFTVASMQQRIKNKLRVETPLVDAQGNAIVALTSMNDQQLDAFPLELHWHKPLTPPQQLLVATGSNRRLQQVAFKCDNGKLSLQMPAFDTHATILALTNSDPLVSLDITGVKRGAANLLMVQPGNVLEVAATVYNPSSRAIPAGKMKLWAPAGWFIDQSQKACPPLKPWDRATIRFRVQAPAIGGAMNLRPLVVKHEAGGKTSTPATEEVWWNRSADDVF